MRRHAKASTTGSKLLDRRGLGGRLRSARTVLTGVALLAVLALAVTMASASVTRNYQSSFATFTGANPQTLAVDQQTGDVYAVSFSGNQVLRFDSAGNPKNFTAGPDAGTNTLTGFSFEASPSTAEIAIDRSGGPADGDVYVTESLGGAVKVFASTGAPLGSLNGSTTPSGSLGEPCGVAVNQANGDLYVSDYNNHLWRYTPSGGPVTNADFSGGVKPGIFTCQVAANGSDVYAVGWDASGPVKRYPASAFVTGSPPTVAGATVTATATAIATDPSSGELYADEGDQISVFSAAGDALYSFGSAAEFGSNSAGVAVKGAGGPVYVADPTNHQIDVFSPPLTLPTATTSAATGVNHVRATLNGHLDANGGPAVTNCHFDWGATASYGNTAPCSQGNDFSAPADVSAQIAGLNPGDSYHFRLSITTTAGTFTGDDQSFTNPAIVTSRPLIGSFGPDGTSDSAFGEVGDHAAGNLAFAQATRRLYAALTDAPGMISGFEASAPPPYPPLDGFDPLTVAGSNNSTLSDVAVDNTALPSAGNVYLVANGTTLANPPGGQGEIYGFDSTGAPLGGNFPIDPTVTPGVTHFAQFCGAAVDPAGNLWVKDANNGTLFEYSSTGVFQRSIATGGSCGLAFDTNGDLYDTGTNSTVFRYTAASNYTSSTLIDSGTSSDLAVDPATRHLFIAFIGASGRHFIREYDASGALVGDFGGDPAADYRGVTVDAATGLVYASDWTSGKIRVFGPRGVYPQVATAPATDVTNTSATIDGTAGPQNTTLTDCHFEWGTTTQYGHTAPCDPGAGSIPSDADDHPVSAELSGLERNTVYHYRLLASNSSGPTASDDATFTTTGPPEVETVGSPLRTATTAQLDARVSPSRAPATYRFEWGTTSSYGQSTPVRSLPSGNEIRFVAERLTGLQANTAYHYRIVADNGNPDGASVGVDRVLVTRASDAPLAHGPFPGPPGSDRVWEQVNVPDTGGNKVESGFSFSDSGDRAVYRVAGGTPDSEGGTLLTQLMVERHETSPHEGSWQLAPGSPRRSQLIGGSFLAPWGTTDLSSLLLANVDSNAGRRVAFFQVRPGLPATPLFASGSGQEVGFFSAAEDSTRAVAVLKGGPLDPAYPAAANRRNLYDITSGSPKLISLLPGNVVGDCDVAGGNARSNFSSGTDVSEQGRLGDERWITPDGRYAFFPSACLTHSSSQLYARDLSGDQTYEVSGPPVSGPSCDAVMLQSTDDAVFFWTQSRLAAEDTAPVDCDDQTDNGDVYRYGLAAHTLSCVTCLASQDADVQMAAPGASPAIGYVGVSRDGSRVYFNSPHKLLLAGAANGIYRVDVDSGDLAFVAPAAHAGGLPTYGYGALSPDGSVLLMRSADPRLNSLGGQTNGGTAQYYRYDDRDRSLVCVSCPVDGSSPGVAVPESMISRIGSVGPGFENGNNRTPLDAAGDVFFATSTPLVPADQNAAAPSQDPSVGGDIYEWRDGRLLLITDGTTGWNPTFSGSPTLEGVSSSGRDVFFIAPEKLTPDAPDAYPRLYDARVGGGFEFPEAQAPCPLEACQGNPKPLPSDTIPGSSGFSGPGNQMEERKGRTVHRSSKKKCKKKKAKKCRKARHPHTTGRAGK